jgi:hypothetical protein
MDKVTGNDFDEYIVVWEDDTTRIYDPFANLENAYQHIPLPILRMLINTW